MSNASPGEPIFIVVPELCDTLSVLFRKIATRLGVAERIRVTTDAETAVRDGGLVIIALRTPRAALAAAMGEGAPPSEALAEWRNSTKSLLAMCRPNRQRITVVDIDRANLDLEGLVQDLSKRLQTSALAEEGPIDKATSAPLKNNSHGAGESPKNLRSLSSDPTLELLAIASLAADELSMNLAVELESMVLGGVEPPPLELPDQVFKAYTSRNGNLADLRDGQIRAEAVATQFAVQNGGHQLLRDQVYQLQKQLELRIVTAQGLAEQRQGFEAKFGQLRRECEALRAECLRLTEELDLKQADLAAAQRRITHLRAEQIDRERMLTAMLFQHNVEPLQVDYAETNPLAPMPSRQ